MNNQPIIYSKDIITGNIIPLVSANNVLLTSQPSLNQLNNVAITTPTNNQVLTYNEGAELWYNADSQGGGVVLPDFISYSVNYIPLNSTLFTSGTYFSVLDNANMSQTPNPPIINFNNLNNLTLTNGIITGLSPTKYYDVDYFIFHRALNALSAGAFNIGLYNGSVATGTIISFNRIDVSNAIYRPIGYKNIITGVSNINPVLSFSSAVYTPSTSTTGFCVNVVIREL